MAEIEMRTTIFVSYSHHDASWLEKLRIHLRPLERDGQIDLWSDQRLKGGEKWREEIRRAIAGARAAILMISPSFLASDFIADDELPSLLRAAEEQGVLIIPIIVSHSLFGKTPELNRFQAINDPKEPLNSVSESVQDAIFVQAATRISELASVASTETKLKNVTKDEITTLLEVLDRRHRQQLKYDAFISVPMNSLKNEAQYQEHRKIGLQLEEGLRNYFGFTEIYGAILRNQTRAQADPATISIRENLEAIQESRLFIMLHTRSNLASSTLAEAGFALALRIPSLYFIWKGAKLPFLLTRAAQAFQHVDSFLCRDGDHMLEMLEKHRTRLLRDGFLRSMVQI